jgi:hypothetical protein
MDLMLHLFGGLITLTSSWLNDPSKVIREYSHSYTNDSVKSKLAR